MRTHGFWLVLLSALILSSTRVGNAAELPRPSLPNNLPIPNEYGAAATFSEEGFVNRADDFHSPYSACVVQEKQTTDPGRALITGRFADINGFKVPSLRGVAARAPYFHNGSAKTLRDVVRHYRQQRGFNFAEQEEQDLVAFLRAL